MNKEVVLSWPKPELNPNSRAHWSKKAKFKKSQRHEALLLAQQAGWHKVEWPKGGRLHVWIDGYAKDKRHRDHDNFLASLKGALDGIADAIGVNDSRFVPHPYIKDEVRKGGEVRIRITGDSNE